MVGPVALDRLIERALAWLLEHLVAALGADDPAVALALVTVEAGDINVLGFTWEALPATQAWLPTQIGLLDGKRP